MSSILIIFPHNPFLAQNGVQTRFLQLLRYFKEKEIKVDIYSHLNFVDPWPESDKNNPLVENVFLWDWKNQDKTSVKSVKTISLEKLRNLVCKGKINYQSDFPDFCFSGMKSHLDKLLLSNNYDYLLMAYPHWANLVHGIPGTIKKVITVEDFISINMFERHKGIDLGNFINAEISRINLFDTAICISEDEKVFFSRTCKKTDTVTIPHFLPFKGQNGSGPKSRDILFVGSDNPFNRDGANWFVNSVAPKIEPPAKIQIVGKVCSYIKDKHRQGNIEYLSYVEDLDSVYADTRIAICPLLGGTGLKIKVVEALSYGIPVVCTSYGVTGMVNKTRNGCCVADDPLEFAAYIDRLLTDEAFYSKVSAEGREFFMENFEINKVYEKLDKVFF